MLKANAIDGCWTRTSVDPPSAYNSFAIGHTNGAGTSASAAITADTHMASGSGTASPASLKVNRWVYATLDGQTGWIPFFR